VAVRRLDPGLFDGGTYDPPFLSQKGFTQAFGGVAPDVVDIHYMWTPDYTRSLRKFAKGARVVYTLHNSFGWGEGVEGRAAYISDSVLKFFARNCDVAVCASHFIMRDVLARGIKPEKLRVVPPGVDPTSDAELAALRKAPGRHPSAYVVFAGRLERTKGLSVLIEAAREAKAKVDFIIIGKGPDLESLEAEARDFAVLPRVHFQGFVDEARKRQLIAQADLFLYPASFEPTGVAVLEAMDLGCPVVATSVGGLPEILDEAGRLVPPGDSDAVARAVDELMLLPGERKRMSAHGRERSAQFAWPKVAAQMEAAFEAARASP
jgi:glycosyltransferase involved in cell wall biosynthesis